MEESIHLCGHSAQLEALRFFTKKASGCRLTTADDNELIDYVCTWGPAIHGHDHPKIREAIADALQQGTSFGTPGPAEVEMAELITQVVPSVEKVRMCNSGTEATMSAIRLARGFTGKDKIIKFAGCYHGHVDSLLVKAGSGALTLGNRIVPECLKASPKRPLFYLLTIQPRSKMHLHLTLIRLLQLLSNHFPQTADSFFHCQVT